MENKVVTYVVNGKTKVKKINSFNRDVLFFNLINDDVISWRKGISFKDNISYLELKNFNFNDEFVKFFLNEDMTLVLDSCSFNNLTIFGGNVKIINPTNSANILLNTNKDICFDFTQISSDCDLDVCVDDFRNNIYITGGNNSVNFIRIKMLNKMYRENDKDPFVLFDNFNSGSRYPVGCIECDNIEFNDSFVFVKGMDIDNLKIINSNLVCDDINILNFCGNNFCIKGNKISIGDNIYYCNKMGVFDDSMLNSNSLLTSRRKFISVLKTIKNKVLFDINNEVIDRCKYFDDDVSEIENEIIYLKDEICALKRDKEIESKRLKLEFVNKKIGR